MVARTARIKIAWPFVSSGEIARQLGVSADTLKWYRVSGILPKGIYWTCLPGSNRVTWNLELCRDWAINGNSESHARAVEAFVKSLASSVA